MSSTEAKELQEAHLEIARLRGMIEAMDKDRCTYIHTYIHGYTYMKIHTWKYMLGNHTWKYMLGDRTALWYG
jgi:hypothetical protein